jgi:hypothetical protein
MLYVCLFICLFYLINSPLSYGGVWVSRGWKGLWVSFVQFVKVEAEDVQ